MKNYSVSHLTRIDNISTIDGDLRYALYFGDKAMAIVFNYGITHVMRAENGFFTPERVKLGAVSPQLALHIRKLLYNRGDY